MSHLGTSSRAASAVDALLGWIPSGGQWAPSIRYLLRRARILEALPSPCTQNLLEVGCGGGTLLIELSELGLDCTGLEASAQAIGLARELVEDSGRAVRLVQSPETSWSENFDIVSAFDVLEHIEDDAGALRQWISWIKPGGNLLLTVPAHPSRWSMGDVWAGHYRRYARKQLLDLMRDQGLQIEHVECYGFPVANLTEFFGAWHYRRDLRRRTATGCAGRESGNQMSGIDRKAYRRALPVLKSLPGRAVLYGALKLQALTAHTDWGSGYLLVARKQ